MNHTILFLDETFVILDYCIYNRRYTEDMDPKMCASFTVFEIANFAN